MDFTHEVVQETLNPEHHFKLLKTLMQLLVPGLLANKYLSGRRDDILSPFKLLLGMATGLWFVVQWGLRESAIPEDLYLPAWVRTTAGVLLISIPVLWLAWLVGKFHTGVRRTFTADLYFSFYYHSFLILMLYAAILLNLGAWLLIIPVVYLASAIASVYGASAVSSLRAAFLITLSYSLVMIPQILIIGAVLGLAAVEHAAQQQQQMMMTPPASSYGR